MGGRHSPKHGAQESELQLALQGTAAGSVPPAFGRLPNLIKGLSGPRSETKGMAWS